MQIDTRGKPQGKRLDRLTTDYFDPQKQISRAKEFAKLQEKGKMFNMLKAPQEGGLSISYLVAIQGVDELCLQDTMFKEQPKLPPRAEVEYKVQYHLTFWNK